MHTRNIFRILVLALLALLPVFVFFFLGNTGEITSTLSRFDAFTLTMLTLLSLTMYLLRYFRWNIICQHNDIHLKHKANVIIYLTGLAMAFTPARGGEILRTYFIPNHDSRIKFAIHSFVIEKIGDLAAIFIYGVIAICFINSDIINKFTLSFTQASPMAIVGAALIIAVLLFSVGFIRGKVRLKLKDIANATINLTKKYVIKNLATSLLIWALQLLIIQYIVEISFLSLTLADSVFIYASSLIIGTASMVPGGLGSFDVTYMMLMSLFKQATENALVALIAIRVFGLWLGVLLGIPAWYLCTRTVYKSKN